MSKKFNITFKNVNNYSKKFNKKKTNKVFKNVNTKIPFKNLVLKSDYIQNKKRIFKKFIDVKTLPTDQKNSGRCWIFAFLNIIRINMIKKYKLENFEFSQNYLFFYDKLEKANYFFNAVYDRKNKNIHNIKNYNIEDLKLINIFEEATNDGGHWELFSGLVEKYGLVPKTNMDDHFHSKHSHDLQEFFNDFLKKSGKQILESNIERSKLINSLLYECYKILVLFLGEPPKKITWQYYEVKKNKKKQRVIENINPLDFYKKYVPYNTKDKVCLINYPCKSIDYYKLYNVELNYHLTDTKLRNFINVPINIMLECIKKSIDNNEAIWTGLDWSKYNSSKEGILDQHAFNYKDIFQFTNEMEKCDSLKYRQSYPSHAVVIRGYNFDNGKTNGFLIENSHGKKEKDFNENYYMSLDWFNDYVYEIVIDKKFVNSKILKCLNKKPITLPYWSPFGSLMKGGIIHNS
jgi:bleomycin hydrolase